MNYNSAKMHSIDSLSEVFLATFTANYSVTSFVHCPRHICIGNMFNVCIDIVKESVTTFSTFNFLSSS